MAEKLKFDHISIQSGIKRDRFALARMAAQNQWRIAREAMGMGFLELKIKSLVHRCFLALAFTSRKRKQIGAEIVGLRVSIRK